MPDGRSQHGELDSGPGWAVTALDGTTELHRSSRFTTRVVDLWRGTNRLWRVEDGKRRQPTPTEMREANEKARKIGTS